VKAASTALQLRASGLFTAVIAASIVATSCADGCSPAPCRDDVDCDQGGICVEELCRDGAGVRYDVAVRGARLIYRNDTGRLDIYGSDGRWILRRGTALASTDSLDQWDRLFSVDGASERRAVVEEKEDQLGAATRLSVRTAEEPGKPSVTWEIAGYREAGFFTFQLDFHNTTDAPMLLAKTIVLRTEEDGGLFLGQHPSTHRILENGAYSMKDHVVQLHPGDTAQNELLATLVPGKFEGNSASNWSHCVKDLESDTVWVAGALTFDASSPVMNLSFDQALTRAAPDGRQSFSYFSAESAYLPALKPVPPGQRFSSELYYVHPTETNAFAGLERYADAIKQQLGIVLWHEKDPANRIPNGWNSWSGSGSTGGYGTDIDEALILENLDVMAEEFRDWGMDWFQVDDGYEPAYGDWVWNQERFPHGPRWLSDQIRARGLRPGLWIAPFTLDANSETVAAHPDWIADKTTLGQILANDYELLDLTHPEVQAWVRELFRTFRQDWNFDWLKMDFSYWALLGDDFWDPTRTREEAYRDAVRIIREEIGEETFFLSVSALGPHIGLVDSDRITLDNLPVWDWDPSVADHDLLNQQGFKPTVRTSARRYYLHDRVWVNHPDLIIFRSDSENLTLPRITLEEAQAFCTYVGLSGGIVKLGDRLVDLGAKQINSVRKLLPIYGKSARPLDLFEREFPELWHLRVEETLDGYDEPYDLVGLIHWGRNWDLSKNPYSEIPDHGQPREYEIELTQLGLAEGQRYVAYEFWTEQLIGVVEGALQLQVPPHTARVVALRPLADRPQFVGWNRHLTMGATDIELVSWDEASRTLVLRAKVARSTAFAPFTYRLAFFVPPAYSYQGYSLDGSALSAEEVTFARRLLQVSFVPEQRGVVTLTLRFAAP